MPIRCFARLCSLVLWTIGSGLMPLTAQVFPWTYEEIIEDVSQSGAKPDLHVDAQGGFHVSYWNANTDQLVYARRPAGTTAWTREVVPESGTFGYVSALITDASGAVHLAYHHNDNGRATLRYARRAPGGDWTIEQLRDSVDVGRYGADLSFPSYVWPSLDIFLQPNGEPGILYFDGVRGVIQFCPVASIRDSYFNYELDLHVLFKGPNGWTDAPFPNQAYLGNVNCINRGERFGEFCQMLTLSDGSYLTLVPGMHNGELLLFRSVGSSLVQWEPFRVDSLAQYLPNPGFFESFSYLDVALQGDSLLHAVYQITEHYGFENRGSLREGLIYTRIRLDSLDSLGQGYAPYHYRFPGGHLPFYYPTLAVTGDSSVAISYWHRSRDELVHQVSTDAGQTWTPDTVAKLRSNTPLHSAVVDDSLHVLIYDSQREGLREALRPVDSLGSWTLRTVTRSERNGTVLASAVRRVGDDDQVFVVFREQLRGNLRWAERLGGAWQITEILPPGNPVSAVELVLDGDGTPHLVYLIEGDNRLTYATRSAGIWQTELLPDSLPTTQISLGRTGATLHLAYFTPQPGGLRYAQRAGGTWTLGVIDTTGPQVGRSPSLAVDVNGDVHVAYVDAGTVQLKFATRQANGAWLTSSASEPQALSPQAIDLAMTTDILPEPVVALKDARTDSVLIGEPGLDGATGLWLFSQVKAPQTAGSGLPLHLILDQRDRPWVAYTYLTSLREIRLARRREGQWFQASVLNNQAQISQAFDFHLVGEDFYLIGRQNEPGNTGLGLLHAPEGLTTLLNGPAPRRLGLFPNPAREAVQVQWPQATPGPMRLSLYDRDGRQLHTQWIGMAGAEPQTTRLSLAAYPPGVYLCVLDTPEGRFTQRLVKQP